MKIISKYVLREHVGPFVFALTALTSLMILNFISRQFGELVGKGLPASVIGEFFLLSIPFTIALTLPMSVLVAVLYAFSRLAAENEVTALKASGVSPWRLVTPALAAGLLMSVFLLAFNDQVLPRANHRLKTLQDDISQTKPTLLLKAQVINAIQEGKFYLKAGKIDQGTGEDARGGDLRSRRPDAAADDLRRQRLDLARVQPGATWRWSCTMGRCSSWRRSDRASSTGCSISTIGSRSATWRRTSRSRRARWRIAATASSASARCRSDSASRTRAISKRRRTSTKRFASAKLPKSARPTKPVHRPPRAPKEPHNIAYLYCHVLARLIGVKKAEAAEVRSAALHRLVQDTVPKRSRDARPSAWDRTARQARGAGQRGEARRAGQRREARQRAQGGG